MDYLQINELYHHGIKGMKWGERRFQDEDGGLTPEGLKRYKGEVSKDGKTAHFGSTTVSRAYRNERLLDRESTRTFKAANRMAKQQYKQDHDKEKYKAAKESNLEKKQSRDANALLYNTMQAKKITTSSIVKNIAGGTAVLAGSYAASIGLSALRSKVISSSTTNDLAYVGAKAVVGFGGGFIAGNMIAKGARAAVERKRANRGGVASLTTNIRDLR